MFTVTKTALCIVAVMIVTGCSSTTPSSSRTRTSTSTGTGSPEGSTGTPEGSTEGNGTIMKDAFDALLRRPSLATVETDYQSMYESIRTRLTT